MSQLTQSHMAVQYPSAVSLCIRVPIHTVRIFVSIAEISAYLRVQVLRVPKFAFRQALVRDLLVCTQVQVEAV